ncbi:CHRD domain-containing protein [Robbsia andropogonis]|nr:CHRD domain-containing protein [Robbsia andropogonis]
MSIETLRSNPLIRMPRGALVASAIVLTTMTASLPAMAKVVHFSSTLTAANEVPPHQTDGTGALTASYDTKSKNFEYEVSYDKLTGPATAAHFHGPALAGENAKPVIPIAADALASPIKGSKTLTPEQAKELLAGKWYFNVHTAANPGGEIRGQIEKTK